ncbi:TMEM43 family protein [Flammeovirga sp. SJP92]|uniref:TMEM43 family protein n=1 Tax=Flammeovirga sp. SJP92 TaxID=1775430 RepID=UPI000B26DA20|nr:TMEM43 family protein [Flammeovirga sp. SJP92]
MTNNEEEEFFNENEETNEEESSAEDDFFNDASDEEEETETDEEEQVDDVEEEAIAASFDDDSMEDDHFASDYEDEVSVEEREDRYVETSTESYGERIGSSLFGILFGFVLLFGSCYLLWWNEGRAVKRADALEEGASSFVVADVNKIDPKNEGKLVHVVGKVHTDETLKDKKFKVEVNGFSLSREVKMFQWVEDVNSKSEKKLGGSKETTKEYTYRKEWSSSLKNSEKFKIAKGHKNPKRFLYKATTYDAKKATFGAYDGSNLMSNNPVDVKVDESNIKGNKYAKLVSDTEIFVGKGTYSDPKVGDMLVTFTYEPNDATKTVMAMQKGNKLVNYTTSDGETLFEVNSGEVSPKNVIKKAESGNNMVLWLCRIGGIILMFVSFTMIFKPLAVLADVIPFIGSIVSFGVSLIAGVLTICFSFITISIAWIAARPVLAYSLLGIGIVAGAFFVYKTYIDKPKGGQSKEEERELEEVE